MPENRVGNHHIPPSVVRIMCAGKQDQTDKSINKPLLDETRSPFDLKVSERNVSCRHCAVLKRLLTCVKEV